MTNQVTPNMIEEFAKRAFAEGLAMAARNSATDVSAWESSDTRVALNDLAMSRLSQPVEGKSRCKGCNREYPTKGSRYIYECQTCKPTTPPLDSEAGEWVADAAARTLAEADAPPGVRSERGLGIEHASWLLHQVATGEVVASKAHRWLGYAQALLVEAEWLTLENVKLANKAASDAALTAMKEDDRG